MLHRTVKHLAAGYDRVRPPGTGVVILAYHRVGAGTTSRVDVPRSAFDDQMAMLADSGRVIDLDAAVDLLEGTASTTTASPVVITFDDGTGDFVDNAVPILSTYGLPATLYLSTAWVDREEPFWGTGAPLSWAALRDIGSTGLVDFGSHTHDHVLLDRTDPTTVAAQLDLANERIEDELHTTPTHFAYPKALEPNADSLALVRQRFRSAALAGTRPNPIEGTDPHLLRRSPIQSGDDMRWYAAKAAGGMGLEDRLRDVANRLRYRRADR
ncbi:MAG: polysaccharide deacetylase family protein [Acidimicrobiia bacterium]|nr:polysaccharide deacetylase family protein [Acidimicrobiia bacterium]